MRTFVPVATALATEGVTSEFAVLDRWYGGRAATVARELGVHHPLLAADGEVAKATFYRRGAHAIWRDVLGARAPIGEILDQRPGSIVVTGNDFGLIEKLVLHEARRRSYRTVLIQDGRLADTRPRQPSVAGLAYRVAKRLVSPAIAAAGFPFLSASEYGEFGVDLVCATGPMSADLLARRAGPQALVVTTGQPRYDALIPLAGRPVPALPRVTMFTTPFAADGLGHHNQVAQEDFAAELWQLLRAQGVEFAVKPHPREDIQRYSARLGTSAVRNDTAAEAIAASTAIVTGISSVIEEAGILRRPVVIAGAAIHGRRFDNRLPDRRTYPRYDTVLELAAGLTNLMRDGSGAVVAEAQGVKMAQEICFDSQAPAAHAVAHAILGL